VLELLNGERFPDQAHGGVATLLDEGHYWCHCTTMYRLLEANAQVRERRKQLRHPVYAKPELLATGPKPGAELEHLEAAWAAEGPLLLPLRHPRHLQSLYSGLDAGRSRVSKPGRAIDAATYAKQGVQREYLTIHVDNGSPMIAKSVAVLMADLGVL
jgi:putative transposase